MALTSRDRPSPETNGTGTRTLEVRAALIRQLYSQSVSGLIGAQVSSVVLVIALWGAVPPVKLFTWLGLYFLLQVIRNWLVLQFRKAPRSDQEVIPWGDRFSAVTFASGLCWGMAGVFLFPEHSVAHQFLMALFLAGISSAAVVVYSPLTQCYLPTVIAEFAPLALRCLYELDSLHLIMGSVMLVYGIVLIITGKHVHNINESSLKLRFEKDDLLGSVMEKQQESDRLNERLKSQIEERNKAEQKLVESEARYRELAELLPQLVFELDLEGKFRFVNRAGLEMMGRTEEDVEQGLLAQEVCFPADWERASREVGEVYKGKTVMGIEYNLTRLDATILPIMTYANPILQGGRIVGVRAVGVDVSELKTAQKELLTSLKEKEVLLREIHHRVKNNLQVVCSLLRVQRRRIEDDRHARMFQESEDRIASMATVYEKLYQSPNLSELNARDYLSSLVRYIRGTHEAFGSGIDLRTCLEDLTLGPDLAIPLGLITTELISNCLKHAFSRRTHGYIEVTLRSVNHGRVEMKVSDNGSGMPPSIDPTKCTSLGLHLVRIFVEQLGGELQITSNGGTSISVQFDRPDTERGQKAESESRG